MKQVGIVIDTTIAYNRGIIRGILRRARQRGWLLQIDLLHRDGVLKLPYRLDGVIGRARWREQAEALERLDAPMVCLAGAFWPENAKRTLRGPDVDVPMLGRTAARHFLERGFREFAFVGYPEQLGTFGREEGFVQELSAAGFACRMYPGWEQGVGRLDWAAQREHLGQWLAGLPRPMAVFATNDGRARDVIDACRDRGLRVPLEVAVLGVDNDEFICEASSPSISSIALPTEQMGEVAADMLAKMMEGKAVPTPRPLPPLAVVTRESSDTLAVEDGLVAEAVRLMQARACEGFGVKELLEELHVSRRSLEMRLRQALGAAPAEFMERVRMRRASDLLCTTDETVERIARECGYRSVPRFIEAFARNMGLSPGKFRQQRSTRRR